MSVTRAEVLAAVNGHPAGATCTALAAELDAPHYNVSGCLSKLASYGKIVKAGVGGPGHPALWKPKGGAS